MNLEPSITWPPTYVVRKHKRARHVKLRATKKRGLEITIPFRFSLKEIPAILEEHKQWILMQLAHLQKQHLGELPEQIDLRMLNTTYQVSYLKSQARLKIIERPHAEIVVLGDIENKEACKELLIKWLRKQAVQHLVVELERISTLTGLSFSRITIRDQQTLWGSCTRDKAINLSYRLIFLPKHLAEHIMIHELCHTVHLNHSAKFWALVAKFDQDWQENRRIMRKGDQYIPGWI